MAVLNQFKNFIRHGKAAREGSGTYPATTESSPSRQEVSFTQKVFEVVNLAAVSDVKSYRRDADSNVKRRGRDLIHAAPHNVRGEG